MWKESAGVPRATNAAAVCDASSTMIEGLLLPPASVPHKQVRWADDLSTRNPKRLRRSTQHRLADSTLHHSRRTGQRAPVRPCMTAMEVQQTAPATAVGSGKTLLCTIVTADSMPGALDEIKQAAAAGADVIELRADYLTELNAETDVRTLLDACAAVGLPAIFTYRPTWEG